MNDCKSELNAKIFHAGILAILDDYSYTTTNVGKSILTERGREAVIDFVEQMGPMMVQAHRDHMVAYTQKYLINALKESK